ncbi:hypothetical protein NBRC3280_0309 [Acetobacter pasteurianus NBRC 3280]|uniref:DUF1269 domain-containing protein n=1 Tax=Acetobacter pasteurianus NBRC 3278 TaxID=1226660 RepID=A0A401X0E2_ACEPA|nr:DUF1269 domain-containing protein [Acetobacter pasteurianus]GCD57827.1 hypothetical protein NBRC3277_0402 [Acetobacter pasteurianus NBRC 3277]GCD61300.1 hypothetical protein NBRC3278_0393 [Acetobacter pasteurianus NBRC 3278]GCD67674.1 hypothetical protein NBRC3280_0309 [Acetobacter pasteurianus NBRC 3280]
MSDLIVLGFDHVDDAAKVLTECRALQKEYLLDLEDAVVVTRDAQGKVHLHQSVNLEKAGASWGLLSGGFWGALVGLLCLNPLAGFLIGSAVGAGAGALSGKFSDYGIDDGFIKQLSDTIPPNTSALFILVRKSQPEKVLADLSQFKGHARILQTSLSPEAEEKLKAALSQVAAAQAKA